MDESPIATKLSPTPPYRDAVPAGGLIFLSGRVALDPATGELIRGDVAAQTRRALRNLETVLGSVGASFADVAKCTVYLTDIKDIDAMNRAYVETLPVPLPARTTVAVAGLPLGAKVEIEMIVARP